MSAISLINSGVAWFVAAAVLAFLFSFQKMCMSVFATMYVNIPCDSCYLWRPEGGSRFPGIRAIEGCQLPCGCRELNQDPL